MPHVNPPHANLICQRGGPASDCLMFLQAAFIELIPNVDRERGGGQRFGEKACNNLWILGNIDRRCLNLN